MFKMMGSIKQWSWVLLIGLLLGGLAWWMAHKPFPPKPQADQTYRASSKNLLPWPNLPPLLRSEELLLGESLTEGAYTLSLTNLGYPAPISLVGAEAETTLYLPVNPGLEAEALDLLLAALPEARGVLEVLAAERPLLQAPLPAKTLRVPLKGVPAENGFLTLTLRVRFPAEDLCAAQRLYRLRLLPESRLHLSGRPTPPKTLAEFFPPYLERVVLYLPDPPPPEAAQATLWLAGFLARTYPGRVPELDLEPYPPRWPPASPFTRYVVWLEEIGAQVQGFALLLGDLAEAARLFLAQPGLREAPFPGEATQTLTLKAPEELGPRVSLAQLGHGPKRVEGYGTLTAAYTFALADLGPDHLPLGLRLRAVHSPVEPKRGYAELLLNGVAFYTAPLEGTVLDLYTPLPSRLLERNNTLEVRFPRRGGAPTAPCPSPPPWTPVPTWSWGEGSSFLGWTPSPRPSSPSSGSTWNLWTGSSSSSPPASSRPFRRPREPPYAPRWPPTPTRGPSSPSGARASPRPLRLLCAPPASAWWTAREPSGWRSTPARPTPPSRPSPRRGARSCFLATPARTAASSLPSSRRPCGKGGSASTGTWSWEAPKARW